MTRRLTLIAYLALRHLATHGEAHGLDIARAADVPGGTMYPALASLEAKGLVASRKETGDQRELGRRLRRYYRLTDAGRTAYDEMAKELA